MFVGIYVHSLCTLACFNLVYEIAEKTDYFLCVLTEFVPANRKIINICVYVLFMSFELR